MSNHDNHTHDDHAHGHPVVSWQIQLAVLATLLFFTLATVLFYNAEKWVEVAFEIKLPGWVNMVGAMSIATVKAVLVCMYFMGLKYDKALNTFAMLFCLFCVGLFLTFSMIDLDTRDRIDPWKEGEVMLGGTGKGLDSPSLNPKFDANPSPAIATGGLSITEYARQKGFEYKGSEEAYWDYYYKGHPGHRHPSDTNNYFQSLGFEKPELSTPNKSIARTGLTEGLFDAVDPSESHKDDAHSSGH